MRVMTEYEVELFDQTRRIPDLHVPLHRHKPQVSVKPVPVQRQFIARERTRKLSKSPSFA